MSLHSNIEPLLQKEMSRREFLLTLGLGIASIFGFSTIIHMLTGKSFESRINQHFEKGYSSSSYGSGEE
jgi:Trp operon repressor